MISAPLFNSAKSPAGGCAIPIFQENAIKFEFTMKIRYSKISWLELSVIILSKSRVWKNIGQLATYKLDLINNSFEIKRYI